MLNPRLLSPQAFQKFRLLAWSSAKQNTLLSHHWHKAIKPCAICTQFRSWLNWTSNALTGHSILLEQFGRQDYGYRSTATLRSADAVQVSQLTAITANHLQPQWTKKEGRGIIAIHSPGYARSLNATLHRTTAVWFTWNVSVKSNNIIGTFRKKRKSDWFPHVSSRKSSNCIGRDLLSKTLNKIMGF